MSKKVVLAYSGGLDTSVAIEWIKDKTGAEVVAVAADVGQGGEDMNVIKQRALDCGAVAAEVLDLTNEQNIFIKNDIQARIELLCDTNKSTFLEEFKGAQKQLWKTSILTLENNGFCELWQNIVKTGTF